jgi:HEAT repeat protein
MTKEKWVWLASPLPLLALLVCILLGYAVLSTGLVDDIFVERNRTRMLNQVEVASSSDPPNVEFLTDALNGADWLVAAAAAERIGQLKQSDELESEQVDAAVQSLFEALASGGHWWRFGWDRDEPEFEQFRGAATEAASKFGLEALPTLLSATSSDSSFEREAACWITLSMLTSNTVDQTTLAEQGILERVEDLARDDPDERVKAACASVHSAIANLQGP